MANYKTTIGNVELVVVNDGNPSRDPLEAYPDGTREQWNEFPELLDNKGHLQSRYGSVAVHSCGKLIFVDTGLQGPDGTLLKEMDQKGVDRKAVDLVVMTHLHPDHVGWNLTDGSPTFPNARYIATKTDWDYWTQPEVLKDAQHITNQVLPLEDLDVLDLIDGEYKITDELTTLPTPGHTPGHISIVIASSGQKGFILGDVSHTPAQAHYTDWNPVFDIDQSTSRITRNTILDRLESDGSLVSAGHYPDPGFGHFIRKNGKRIWQGI